MPFMLLLVTFAHAAKPPFCSQDLSDIPRTVSVGTFIDAEKYRQRVVRPGLMRLQSDLCRCMPFWSRNRPASIKAHLHSKPNKGELRVEYIVKQPWSRPIRRMLKCMGAPKMTFEPIRYVSDMVLPDGKEETFPYFPLVIVLDEKESEKSHSK